MIVPMVKYSMLIHHGDFQDFISEIRKIGVIHIVENETALSEKVLGHLQFIKDIDANIRLLKRRQKEAGNSITDLTQGAGIFDDINLKKTEIEALTLRQTVLQKEVRILEPWGAFDTSVIRKLSENGIKTRFYICPEKKFNTEWKDQYNLSVISQLGSTIYFVIFLFENEVVEIAADEWKMPERSVSEAIAELADIDERLRMINQALDHHAETGIPALEKLKEQYNSLFDYDKAIHNSASDPSEKIKIVEGWVPQSKVPDLEDYLAGSDIYYFTTKPKPSDKVPILLTNNKFSRLFEPIAKLYSLPAYAELDLTPFFAPFFMFFFGFCLGDIGYGVVILIAATIAKFKIKGDIRPILTLGQFLGVGTIVMGFVSGTLFGVGLLDKDWVGDLKNYMLSPDNLFNLALILGVVQILFGLGIQAVNKTIQFGFKYALSPIGWIIFLTGLILKFAAGIEGLATLTLIYAGMSLIVLFNDPDAKIFARIGKGVWDLYNITGFFGDVLSYIRLFALGVSSGILGLVINQVALQIKEVSYIGPVLFVVFLLVGHTANLLISSLGSFVHPMRLTFVEFYKNSGFAGGGKEYKPFK